MPIFRSGESRFLTDPQRLNVAITRAVDVFLIVANLKALSSQSSSTGALEAGDELDPESKNYNLEVLKAGRRSLQEIFDYYK